MDDKTDQLNDAIIHQLVSLKKQGDIQANLGQYLKAIEKYQQAYELLPEPREKWQAATWILGIIGDAYFLNRNYKEAFKIMNYALATPEGIGNPFIHLRIEQSAYELGDMDRAKDDLMRAYMGGGEEIFLQDNPIYLEFLSKHADIKITKHFRR